MRIRRLSRDAASSIALHGASKSELGDLNSIAVRSISTELAYRDAHLAYLRWCSDHRLALDEVHTRGMMLEFLDDYAELHAQKSVNKAIKALEKIFSVHLPQFESGIATYARGRAYSFDEVGRVASRQSTKNGLASLLCYDAGLRAHECFTLRRPARGEGPSSHRIWLADRFAGRTDFDVYLVTGKGGLTREVAISQELSEELQKHSRAKLITVRDREVDYVSQFDIGGGHALSSSFSRISTLEFGYSNGLHGARHSFAQNRLVELIKVLGPRRALEVLAQELGHFRSSISLAYLIGR